MKKKFSTFVNYANLLSALLLTATSIYYYQVQKIAFILFFSTYLLEIFVDKKWENIHLDKKSIYYMIMAFFFVLVFIYFPFEESSKYFSRLSVKRLSILGFAIVGFLGVNDKFRLNYFLNTFIISSIIAIVYLIFIRIGIVEFFTNPMRVEAFTNERILHVNSHMAFDFYLNVSLIGIWYILTRSWNRTIWWKRYLYLGALTLIFSTLSLSEGRSGFIVAILLMLSFIFIEIWKRRKMMGIIIGFLIPFLLIGIVSQHKRMSEKSLEAEPRIFLWESALSVIKESPVLGHGISDAQVHFDIARMKFQTEEFKQNWKSHALLDAHNQYLQTTMEFGLVGLLLLLFLYTYPIFIADKNRQVFSILLLFLCAYQSFFDMFIIGQFSALFGIIVILILSVKNNIVPKTSEEILTV